MAKLNLIGQRYGKLIVIKEVERHYQQSGKPVRRWLCKCDCGNEKVIYQSSLRSGNTKSCGCGCEENRKKIMMKLGHHINNNYLYPKLTNTIMAMRCRCNNPNSNEYYRYGGRGIKICDEWMDKKAGISNFINWALNNGYKDGLTIDRIDNDKGYFPENCKWSDRFEQMSNTSKSKKITYQGKQYCFASLGRKIGVSSSTINKWYQKGNKTGEEIIKAIEQSIKENPQTARLYKNARYKYYEI